MEMQTVKDNIVGYHDMINSILNSLNTEIDKYPDVKSQIDIYANASGNEKTNIDSTTHTIQDAINITNSKFSEIITDLTTVLSDYDTKFQNCSTMGSMQLSDKNQANYWLGESNKKTKKEIDNLRIVRDNRKRVIELQRNRIYRNDK